MATIASRFKILVKSKSHQIADKAENMDETLDYSYQRQLDMLAKVKRGLVDIATSRKQVDNQIAEADTQCKGLTAQAEKAIEIGREDLAREALARKAGIIQSRNDLEIQRSQLIAQEEKLTETSEALKVKVEQFRIKKETIKASYAAASAQTHITEAFAGIGGEFADIGLALSRAEDKTMDMQARSEAMAELVQGGAFDNSGDWIDVELNQLSIEDTITNELASIKAKALPAGKNAD